MDHKASRTLCGHLEASHEGIVPFGEIQTFVGVLSRLKDSTYKDVADEISDIFTHALIGDMTIDQSCIPHIRRIEHTNDAGDIQDVTYLGCFKYLNRLLKLDPGSAVTQSIWAGMTNLKSVIYRLDSTLSRSDKDKSYRSITHITEIPEDILDEYNSFVKEFIPYLISGMVIPDAEYLPVWAIASSEKRMVHINQDGSCVSMSRNNDKLFDINNSVRIPSIRELALEDPSEFLSRTLYGEKMCAYWNMDSFPEPFPEEKPIGIISFSPKNGSKVRVIGMMEPLLGSLAYPTGRVLKSINTQTTIQWVDDQDGARQDLQRTVSANVRRRKPRKIKSFDQSSFTDNFSYEKIQRPVLLCLRDLGVFTDYDVKIIDTICTGLYDLNKLRKGRIGRYGTGTPMGSYPSFPLASMCNGVLAAWAYTRVNKHFPSKSEHYAWIVGDDCVILDPLVAEEYENICGKIGLKVNTLKSISSDRCVEFCSTFITPEGIFKKKKLPEFTALGSLVEAISYYRPDHFIRGFPQFEVITQELLQIPKPFGLGPEVDLDKDQPAEGWESPLTLIRSKVAAKLRAGEIANLKDQVTEAREHFHAFSRSGMDAESRGLSRPLPDHVATQLLEKESGNSEPILLPFEQSMIDEANILLEDINSSPLGSQESCEACVRICEIYAVLKERHKEALSRVPITFKIAPKRQSRTSPNPPSDLQSLLTDLRSTPLDPDNGFSPRR